MIKIIIVFVISFEQLVMAYQTRFFSLFDWFVVRTFRRKKKHERRIHGNHAGILEFFPVRPNYMT